MLSIVRFSHKPFCKDTVIPFLSSNTLLICRQIVNPMSLKISCLRCCLIVDSYTQLCWYLVDKHNALVLLFSITLSHSIEEDFFRFTVPKLSSPLLHYEAQHHPQTYSRDSLFSDTLCQLIDKHSKQKRAQCRFQVCKSSY